ncbi:MAG: SRPBCC family protein [Pseudomonadota bacterium]
MSDAITPPYDAKLDLAFTRDIALTPAQVWRAWTEPQQLLRWFTPAPWQTVECDIDLRPGGLFRTVMRSPEGQDFPNTGCYLEVVAQRKLVWTNAVAPGYRPAQLANSMPCDSFFFTAIIVLEEQAKGTRYHVQVMHSNAADCQKHAALGFQAGWNAALEQMIGLYTSA